MKKIYNPSKPYKYKILELIESTWKTPYLKLERGLYPVITKKFNYKEVQHTDGIGTKGKYHWYKKTYKNAVIDSLAMNLNDLAMVGATPYSLQNHIVLPEDNHKAILEIVQAFSAECKKYKIAMTGGETSIHNNLEDMDISVTVCGFLKNKFVNKCKTGDILIGIKSNGIHSNGISFIRELFKNEIKTEFTVPTRIYINEILGLFDKQVKINGMMHITGGAFTKLKDILGNNDVHILKPKKLKPQNIFFEIFKKGVTEKNMYTRFNCGIGFILSVPKSEVTKVLKVVKNSEIIGEVKKGTGKVLINSSFTENQVAL